MVPMRRVTGVHGSFRAHVLAARFAAEGIDVQLRGPLDSQYALTVGALARVEVWVPEDQMADAEYLLLSAEVDEALAAPAAWAGPARGARRTLRWVAVVVLAVAVVVPLLAQLSPR